MKEALKGKRANPEEASDKHIRAENDGLKKIPDGCKRKKVLGCFLHKGDIQLKAGEPAPQRRGLVLNPSAIGAFEVTVKYWTVTNTAHKPDTNRRVVAVTCFRTPPFDAGCSPPFQSSRSSLLYIERVEDILCLSHPGLLQ